MKSPEEEKHEEEAPSPKESAMGSYTPCETLFLRLQHEKRGVMQLHKATWQDRGEPCKRQGHDTSLSQVAEEHALLGYRLILRVDEVWPMLHRAQQFYNFHTKMPTAALVWSVLSRKRLTRCTLTANIALPRSNLVAGDIAGTWFVDVQKHIIRRADYKGSKERHALCLAFDGLTLPGVVFIASRLHIEPVCH